MPTATTRGPRQSASPRAPRKVTRQPPSRIRRSTVRTEHSDYKYNARFVRSKNGKIQTIILERIHRGNGQNRFFRLTPRQYRLIREAILNEKMRHHKVGTSSMALGLIANHAEVFKGLGKESVQSVIGALTDFL